MKQQYKSFMGQFAAARKEVEGMRSWMKQSAKVATLTYPSVKPTEVLPPPAQRSKKKG